jgi:hypothetical protein
MLTGATLSDNAHVFPAEPGEAGTMLPQQLR